VTETPPSIRRLRGRAGLVFALGVYTLLVSIPLALSVVLLFTAETLAGRLFAIDALVLLALPPALLFSWRDRPRGLRLPAALGVIFVLLFGVLRALVPRGPSGEAGPGPKTRYPQAPYRPFALSNLLPEIDQLKLGTYFISFGDPLIDSAGAARLRESVLGVYRPMERDPAFRELGSAMYYAYADEDSGHLYEYVPAGVLGERPPAVVFLHGSAGNFKGYLHVWKPVADAGKFVVVAPSFGFGNWQREGGLEAIERAREHALNELHADPSRIWLAGLSNGGRGVTRAIASLGAGDRRYAGVVLLSAVIEPDVVERAAAFRGLPTLVVHGKRDDRLPWNYVEEGLAALRGRGADLTLQINPDEDHFHFFSRAEEVQGWVGGWLGERLAGRPRPAP
jgi:predicted esterase